MQKPLSKARLKKIEDFATQTLDLNHALLDAWRDAPEVAKVEIGAEFNDVIRKLAISLNRNLAKESRDSVTVDEQLPRSFLDNMKQAVRNLGRTLQ